jgi:hypothetical protein
VGDYASREEAEKMKVKISSYFPDASIVSFKDGKKIKMNEAEKTPNQKLFSPRFLPIINSAFSKKLP